jgi:hypothetical protein
MENKQVEAFYKEIGQVCQKYKIGAFVGWWFDGRHVITGKPQGN